MGGAMVTVSVMVRVLGLVLGLELSQLGVGSG